MTLFQYLKWRKSRKELLKVFEVEYLRLQLLEVYMNEIWTSASEEWDWKSKHEDMKKLVDNLLYQADSYHNRLNQMREACETCDISRMRVLENSWFFERDNLNALVDDYFKLFRKYALEEFGIMEDQAKDIEISFCMGNDGCE